MFGRLLTLGLVLLTLSGCSQDEKSEGSTEKTTDGSQNGLATNNGTSNSETSGSSGPKSTKPATQSVDKKSAGTTSAKGSSGENVAGDTIEFGWLADELKVPGNKNEIRKIILNRSEIPNEELTALKEFPNLTEVVVNGFSLGDEGLKYFAELKNLKSLTVKQDSLTDAGLKHLKDLENLEELDLTLNEDIAGSGFEALSKLKKLRVLILDRTVFDNDGAKYLEQFPKLEKLNINEGYVDDEGLEDIGKLTSLVHLEIEALEFEGRGLKHLASLTKLKELYMGQNEFPDGFDFVSSLKELEVLDLGSATISDESLAAASGLSNLKRIDLYEAEITDKALVHLKDLTQLKILELSNNSIDGSGFESLKNLPLEEIRFCGLKLKPDCLSVLEGKSNMRIVDLLTTGVTDDDVKFLDGMNKVEYFRTAGSPGITNATIKRLTHSPDLKELIVNESKVDDAGLEMLSSFPKLKEVYLVNCKGVTDKSLEVFMHIKTLEKLNFSGTQMTPDSKKALLEKFNYKIIVWEK